MEKIHMKICVYTGIDYTDDDFFFKRLDIFKRTLLPSLGRQSYTKFNWQILMRSRHTYILRDIMFRAYPNNYDIIGIPDDWEEYHHVYYKGIDLFNFKDYDIQIRLDSDDLVDRRFIDSVVQIKTRENAPDTVVSYQWRVYDTVSGETYRTAKKWDKRCSAFAALLNPKDLTVMATKHSNLQYKAGKFLYVADDSFCTATVHGANQEISKTRISKGDTLIEQSIKYKERPHEVRNDRI